MGKKKKKSKKIKKETKGQLGKKRETAREKMIGQSIGYRYDVNLLPDYKRLNPDDAALRVYNYLHAMTLEAQLLARACGKTNIHSLEPEDMAALTMEASALAKVPLSGTNHTVGVDDFHKI